MDRTLEVPLAVPFPRGRRIEVIEGRDPEGRAFVRALGDIDGGVRYEFGAGPAFSSWLGIVLSCTVNVEGPRTTLLVDPFTSAAAETEIALRGADAAAEAATEEAHRWAGIDRPERSLPTRNW